MKYQIVRTVVAPVGVITMFFDRAKKVIFDKAGGETSKADDALLASLKKDGKWDETSYFVRLIKAGRLKISGDKQLEALFGVDLPKIADARKPAKADTESSADLAKRISALEKQFLEAKQAEETAATNGAGSDAGDKQEVK